MNKKIFNHIEFPQPDEKFQAKQEFNSDDVEIEVEPETPSEVLEGELLTEKFDQAVTGPRWFGRALMAIFLLFLLATIAQSVQWLVDTWQANEWIYFAFALVSCGAIALGFSVVVKELLRLRKLRQHLLLQQKSAVQIAQDFSNEQAQELCLKVAEKMKLDEQHPNIVQWKKQLSDAYSGQEVSFLFSQNVLQPVDQKVKKLITKSAIENATVIAISPLAVVDLFFMAWRNIRLINQIAKFYGIELGYFSRLRLMKLVLINMAFAGATELVQEVGMDWFSQDLAAKLSTRVAQGIGAGLLTARLGVKAMEFCRPLAFQKDEKPRLGHIHRELLSHLKSAVFNSTKLKEKERL